MKAVVKLSPTLIAAPGLSAQDVAELLGPTSSRNLRASGSFNIKAKILQIRVSA